MVWADRAERERKKKFLGVSRHSSGGSGLRQDRVFWKIIVRKSNGQNSTE